MKTLKALAICIALLSSRSALAQTDVESGTMLLEGCQAVLSPNPSPTMDIKIGMCMGRVSAVRDLLRTINALNPSLPAESPFKACIGKEITTADAIRTVVKTLEPHPEELSKRSTALILYALTKGYPCPASP